ncbi:YybH family protein [Burkholderia sp. 22PA0106]|uniref:YybH family protein n=1 Tax=Burkholderia sp. 22PA0106 TaxID=3237371 RepID=UPI0039C40396
MLRRPAGCAARRGFARLARHGDSRRERALGREAYARGDHAALGALYTDDGTLLPPGEDRVMGRAAIVAYFTKHAQPGAAHTIRFSHAEVYGDGRMATELCEGVRAKKRRRDPAGAPRTPLRDTLPRNGQDQTSPLPLPLGRQQRERAAEASRRLADHDGQRHLDHVQRLLDRGGRIDQHTEFKS